MIPFFPATLYKKQTIKQNQFSLLEERDTLSPAKSKQILS
ncbi:hypothetical protein SRDD_16660 [Serratia sp. DD3]|nr:hypothetical protein SRDD_44970 [Serratia sp. DD3]KEY59383.1 hypothetical protein SRDD_16660 [Serratia sp. DD3]